MKASPMAAKWASSNNQTVNYGGVNENDLVMDHFLLQKSCIGGIDFVQNCDLPPPLKVFSGQDKTVVSSMNRVCGIMGRGEESDDFNNNYDFDGLHEKIQLLKALRLSQTRAREAEKRAAGLAKERDCISKAFYEDSLRLLAYRQWMRLLDLQVSKLQSQYQEEDDGHHGIEVSWFVALAFSLGIVGVGFAFGYRYFF